MYSGKKRVWTRKVGGAEGNGEKPDLDAQKVLGNRMMDLA